MKMLSMWQNSAGCETVDPFELIYWSPSRNVSRDTGREMCRVVYIMYQDARDTEASTKDIHVVRSKIFNFHSVRSETILKPQTLRVKENKCANTR